MLRGAGGESLGGWGCVDSERVSAAAASARAIRHLCKSKWRVVGLEDRLYLDEEKSHDCNLHEQVDAPVEFVQPHGGHVPVVLFAYDFDLVHLHCGWKQQEKREQLQVFRSEPVLLHQEGDENASDDF